MAEVVYVLCALTSFGCTVLLFRGYVRSRARMLLWSSLCFACLALNNAILFVDRVLVPAVNMMTARNMSALVGLLLLIYGLIWDAD